MGRARANHGLEIAAPSSRMPSPTSRHNLNERQ